MACLTQAALQLYRVALGQVLNAVLSAGNELEAQEMLESLVQLADISPLFFRTNVVSAVSLREA